MHQRSGVSKGFPLGHLGAAQRWTHYCREQPGSRETRGGQAPSPSLHGPRLAAQPCRPLPRSASTLWLTAEFPETPDQDPQQVSATRPSGNANTRAPAWDLPGTVPGRTSSPSRQPALSKRGPLPDQFGQLCRWPLQSVSSWEGSSPAEAAPTEPQPQPPPTLRLQPLALCATPRNP